MIQLQNKQRKKFLIVSRKFGHPFTDKFVLKIENGGFYHGKETFRSFKGSYPRSSVGAAALQQKNIRPSAEEGQTLSGEIKEAVAKTAEKTIKMPAPDPNYRNTERGKYEKNSKAFTTPTVTTKHSPVPKNRKALTTKMHIWWAADWLLSQQHASL